MTLAADAVRRLTEARLTVAVAESLTGGAVCDALVDVPGASVVLRGGVVAYATGVKADLLGVPRELLDAHGAVHPEVAREMAERVRVLLGADLGVATTGVAGPDPQDGRPPGEVYVALAGAGPTAVEPLTVTGDRAAVRAAAVRRALELLLRAGDARR
ncbi:CinA family protein [Actinotalea sp. M2MS4P-6]|uniref:CinA family protein n=1 Tax=Actinotalea sp. M2MS4P-6 TaxID=2983762 RepID=UPI0021E41FF3|nr:CinA family protein [Actinotalea sp. M2MS4P-6]MCV2396145.1 CinA family protein [Actinotalea sp. M2MS4P-6]